MGSSLKPTHGDNDSHHLLDILDKTKDNNRRKLEPMTAQLFSTDQIHPVDIEAIATSPIHHSMSVRNAEITNCDKQTPIFAISLPPHPPTTNHSKLLITPTSPCLPTADDLRIPQPSYAPYGTIPSANTKPDNHLNTPKTDPQRCPTLLNQQSQLGTNTNQLHAAETYHKLSSHSTPTAINTTVVAPMTACNTQHGGATHTRHNTTDTPQAFQPPTDNASHLITTAHSHITALVAHLQRLYHPPPPTHITTPILTQPIRSDLRQMLQPFTEANTHDTAPTVLNHAPKSLKITAVARGTQNSTTPLDSPTDPTVSFNHRRNNMTQPPFMDVSPTDVIKLSTSLPHQTRSTTPTLRNKTSSHEPPKTTTTTTTTTAAERTQHLKLPYDGQEFPRPPEIIPSSSKTSLNVTHPTTTTMMTMTTTASVE